MKHLIWILCFAAHLSQAAITQIEMNKAINKLRHENRDYDRLWKFLKSIGWKVAVQNNLSQGVQMIAGQPLTLKNFPELQTSTNALCILVDPNMPKNPEEIAQSLFEQYLPSAVDQPASQEGHRLKLAKLASQAAEEIGKVYKWPDDETHAIGAGFEKFFRRKDVSLEELIQLNPSFKQYKHLNDVIHPQDQASYASWVKREEVSSSKAILSLPFTGCKQSGCQIALGSVMLRMLQMSYDDKPAFDASFEQITINNALHRPTKLIPSVKEDHNGEAKIAQGRNALVGEGAYITSIFHKDVTTPNYAGENVIITHMSQGALSDLKSMGGFGFLPQEEDLDQLEYADKSERPALKKTIQSKFKGVSGEMVRYWQLSQELKKKTRLNHSQLVELIKNRNLLAVHSNHRKLYREIWEILDRPYFQETLVWGHPAGEQKLADWILMLQEFNPRTPYAMFLYDYGLQTIQWENYKQAHLGPILTQAGKLAENACLGAVQRALHP